MNSHGIRWQWGPTYQEGEVTPGPGLAHESCHLSSPLADENPWEPHGRYPYGIPIWNIWVSYGSSIGIGAPSLFGVPKNSTQKDVLWFWVTMKTNLRHLVDGLHCLLELGVGVSPCCEVVWIWNPSCPHMGYLVDNVLPQLAWKKWDAWKLQTVVRCPLDPGKLNGAPFCHSVSEQIFQISENQITSNSHQFFQHCAITIATNSTRFPLFCRFYGIKVTITQPC